MPTTEELRAQGRFQPYVKCVEETDGLTKDTCYPLINDELYGTSFKGFRGVLVINDKQELRAYGIMHFQATEELTEELKGSF